MEDGTYVLRDSPGLGLRVDEEEVAASSHLLPHPLSAGPHVRPERAGHRLHGGEAGQEAGVTVLNA
ncbi:hypothetical protein SAMN05216188_121141 [Lentzea xinjiangensis]|uniref:Uncharacterized protein n=1 Tax=Lentzea xinjiangensis TaxID=402600 RepID=A0A1H9UIM1_9PSEU|nr:hypothetical protein [Lentzea xinjiangensis]SES09212.1 hypothetical protein SAMN05216188_121141 [Lentzea xinjiangensis]